MAGKGERILLVGAGGAEGWEECEVIKMSKQKGNYNFYSQQLLMKATTFLNLWFSENKMEYKDDLKNTMNAQKWEKFLHKTLKKVKKRHKKVAVIMDNASYHTKYVRLLFLF